MLNIWCIKMQVSKSKQTKKQQSDSSSKTYTWGVLGTLHYIWGLFECECEWLLSFVFFMMSCNKMVPWPWCNPAFGQRHFQRTPAHLQPSGEGVQITGTMANLFREKEEKNNNKAVEEKYSNDQPAIKANIWSSYTHRMFSRTYYLFFKRTEVNSWNDMICVALRSEIEHKILVILESVCFLFPFCMRSP